MLIDTVQHVCQELLCARLPIDRLWQVRTLSVSLIPDVRAISAVLLHKNVCPFNAVGLVMYRLVDEQWSLWNTVRTQDRFRLQQMGQKRVVHNIFPISEVIPDRLVGENSENLNECEIEAREECCLVVWPGVYQLVDNKRSNFWELRRQS